MRAEISLKNFKCRAFIYLILRLLSPFELAASASYDLKRRFAIPKSNNDTLLYDVSTCNRSVGKVINSANSVANSSRRND